MGSVAIVFLVYWSINNRLTLSGAAGLALVQHR